MDHDVELLTVIYLNGGLNVHALADKLTARLGVLLRHPIGDASERELSSLSLTPACASPDMPPSIVA